MYVRHAESFLGQAIGSNSAEALPRVLRSLQAAAGPFAGACEAAAAAAAALQQGPQPAAAAALQAQLPAIQAMDACLRLLTRCGPSFPTRGAAEPAPPLLPGERISGAHAAQALRSLFHLATAWLQAVQTLAAAQQAAQPATPAGATAAAGAALRALLLAGARVYKAAGSLTATWLSQLVAALVQGSADPDAAAVAQGLVHGVLAAAADLLRLLASPRGLDPGWRPALHQASVWAAESLVSLSSIALSSGIRPPPALLDAVWRSEQAQARPGPQACMRSLGCGSTAAAAPGRWPGGCMCGTGC